MLYQGTVDLMGLAMPASASGHKWTLKAKFRWNKKRGGEKFEKKNGQSTMKWMHKCLIHPIIVTSVSCRCASLHNADGCLGCPKKHFFGCAAWQANIRWPVMPETRWQKIAAILWVLVPGLQEVSDPYSKVENSKLSYKAHRMLIRKLLGRKTDLISSNHSTIDILENTDE